jgi:hypothetical protein
MPHNRCRTRGRTTHTVRARSRTGHAPLVVALLIAARDPCRQCNGFLYHIGRAGRRERQHEYREELQPRRSHPTPKAPRRSAKHLAARFARTQRADRTLHHLTDSGPARSGIQLDLCGTGLRAQCIAVLDLWARTKVLAAAPLTLEKTLVTLAVMARRDQWVLEAASLLTALTAACGAGDPNSGGEEVDLETLVVAPAPMPEFPPPPAISQRPTSAPTATTAEPTGPTAGSPATEAAAEDATRECSAPPGVSGAPEDISQLVELLNALPRPVTLSCFLSSLERPLQVFATSSRFSAQPAIDEQTPRTFILRGALAVSVVPGGDFSELLEFGYRTATDRSIKGEIEFPVVRTVTPAQLIDRVQRDLRTTCSNCHGLDARVDDAFFGAAKAFESKVLKPIPGFEVDLESLRAEANGCDPAVDPDRCRNLNALFGFGEVLPGSL